MKLPLPRCSGASSSWSPRRTISVPSSQCSPVARGWPRCRTTILSPWRRPRSWWSCGTWTASPGRLPCGSAASRSVLSPASSNRKGYVKFVLWLFSGYRIISLKVWRKILATQYIFFTNFGWNNSDCIANCVHKIYPIRKVCGKLLLDHGWYCTIMKYYLLFN